MNTSDSTATTSWAGLSVDQSVLKVSASSRCGRRSQELRERHRRTVEDERAVQGRHHPGSLGVAILQRGVVRRPPGFLRAIGGAVSREQTRRAGKVIEPRYGQLVRKSCFTGVENQFSNGVSIYFPWSDVAPSYEQLAFAKTRVGMTSCRSTSRRRAGSRRGFKDGRRTAIGFPRRQTIQVRVGCPGQ